MSMASFDPRSASEIDILARAAQLDGRTLGELEDLTGSALGTSGKGSAGHIVERFFSIRQNSLSEPDFLAAGIELKVVPVIRTSKGQRIKERTFITMIDYFTLPSESWDAAHLRSKLDLLLIYYEHLPGQPVEAYPIIRWIRWKPDRDLTSLLRHDWEAIKAKVDGGLAEDLTESEGYILSACTKGPGGGALRSQPFSDAKAPARAFALKPSFTLNLFLDDERAEIAELRRLDVLQTRYSRFVGRTVGEMAETVGVPSSKAKNWAARVVRRSVAEAAGRPIEDLGLTVRVPRVDRRSLPYEAISFPSFRHSELVEEEWQDSLLLSYVEYMLFAPVRGDTKKVLPSRCTVLAAVYWKPTEQELSLMREEWTMFRDLVRRDSARSMPTAAETKAIHVRTKGRDSSDLDVLPDGSMVTKKAFWLNKKFMQRILLRYSD
jgi:DNA mismatch repair endonuclease MutH